MADYDIVFQKMEEALRFDTETFAAEVTVQQDEYQEIDEIRRFAADLEEPEPATFAST